MNVGILTAEVYRDYGSGANINHEYKTEDPRGMSNDGIGRSGPFIAVPNIEIAQRTSRGSFLKSR